MEYEEAVRRLAPCGLDCSRCADYASGEIQKLSVRLGELLNGYLRVARVKEDIEPVFTGYPQFEEVLKTFAQAACSGCRGNNVIQPAYEGDRCGGVLPGAKQTTEVLS